MCTYAVQQHGHARWASNQTSWLLHPELQPSEQWTDKFYCWATKYLIFCHIILYKRIQKFWELKFNQIHFTGGWETLFKHLTSHPVASPFCSLLISATLEEWNRRFPNGLLCCERKGSRPRDSIDSIILPSMPWLELRKELWHSDSLHKMDSGNHFLKPGKLLEDVILNLIKTIT